MIEPRAGSLHIRKPSQVIPDLSDDDLPATPIHPFLEYEVTGDNQNEVPRWKLRTSVVALVVSGVLNVVMTKLQAVSM